MPNHDGDDLDPNDHYDQFPPGASIGGGADEGFNTLRRLNDPNLFTEEAKADPVVQAFLDAPFSVTYAQFKSSSREAEWFIHKPHRALGGRVDGIDGSVDGLDPDNPKIGTYVINHERTLARRIIRVMVVADGEHTGQVIHKEDGS